MGEQLRIIYKDKDLIVLNKPSGIALHGGKSVIGPTVVDFLLKKFPEIRNVGDEPEIRPGLVHRLDKNTSGVVLVARNQKSFVALKELFKNRQMEKTYQAIVCGQLKNKKGVIDKPIGRLVKNPLKRGVEEGRNKIRGAREAITEYKVIKEGKQFSWLELKPKTGRMHQLRVHLKSLGHPVACDKLYGGEKVACPEGAARQLLHANFLTFAFPAGRKLRFEADPPKDFKKALKILGFY